jgi:multiple sugar transport system permease protein
MTIDRAATVGSPAVSVAHAWRRFRERHGRLIDGYLFTAPFLLVYLVVLVVPLIQGVWISLHNWQLLRGPVAFLGIDNYVRMLTDDPRFWTSLLHTVQFAIVATPLVVGVGLLQALGLNRAGRSMSILRGIFFASYILSISVVTLVWSLMYHPTSGILAEFLHGVGLQGVAWLRDPTLAMPAVIVTTIWWNAGFHTVVFLAGLQDIPVSLYEAASLEGAGRLRSLAAITIPMLRRTFVLVIITQAIWSFQIFGQVYLMTEGGPNNATRVLVQYVYETGLRQQNLGYASAMATFLFGLMLVISLFQYRAATRRGDGP